MLAVDKFQYVSISNELEMRLVLTEGRQIDIQTTRLTVIDTFRDSAPQYVWCIGLAECWFQLPISVKKWT